MYPRPSGSTGIHTWKTWPTHGAFRGFGCSNRALNPIGEKSAYTDKQLRQAHHIEESLESKGVPHDKAVGIAWSTVNKTYGGGLREKGSAFNKLKDQDPAKLQKELQDDGKIDRRTYVEHNAGPGHHSNEDLMATSPEKHLALENYIKKGGRIVSDHSNTRGEDYHTIVVQLPEGSKQAFANIKKETLEKILSDQNAQDQAIPQQEQGSQERALHHTHFEEYISQGAKVISEHTNVRGDDYHTVILELPNGRRQTFANVKSDKLNSILGQQDQGNQKQVFEGSQMAQIDMAQDWNQDTDFLHGQQSVAPLDAGIPATTY